MDWKHRGNSMLEEMGLELGFEVLAERELRKNLPGLEDGIGGGGAGGWD